MNQPKDNKHPAQTAKSGAYDANEDLKKLLGEHQQFFPTKLVAGYPHVIASLTARWQNPAAVYEYFDSLFLTDVGREGRKGFPLEVMQEIVRLREFYQRLAPTGHNSEHDPWSDSIDRPTNTVEKAASAIQQKPDPNKR